MNRKSISFADASGAWLLSRTLSPTTLSCYRGEINRLAHYASHTGVDRLTALDGDIWRRYIRSLTKLGSPRISGRSNKLKFSSQMQALRITNAFLIWAWESHYIAWRPTTEDLNTLLDKSPREIDEKSNVAPAALSAGLPAALTGNVLKPSLEGFRGLLALNLSYWGCLSPRELVLLKQNSISTPQNTSAALITLGQSKVLVPGHVRHLWSRYIGLRKAEFGKLMHQGLFSVLERDERASAWTLWNSIRMYQINHLGHEIALSGHRLRSHYVHQALKKLSPPYEALLDNADLRYLRLESSKYQGRSPSNTTPAYGRFVEELCVELATLG